jgi:hypothetical protein
MTFYELNNDRFDASERYCRLLSFETLHRDNLQVRTVPYFMREAFYSWMQEAVFFNMFLCLNPSTFEETKFLYIECYLCV